ncbi:alpha-amylase [Xanthomonas phaseoli pv. phaseoli]|uniref:Alpha-amylase n=1 Tax=Xanthomonas campestris pv. phaseoli TaxID=317013 RepID=A0AB38E0H6_XANCH|nr:alpha-amylase [Xanthomonas phaseoli pv. phaseoli]AZU29070.1 alpha-amylase [Xanthomonas sp. ISO98C4]AZU24700.1 alpha-amylase [Xanthomonas phaseoli pv. phaseoli]AZU33467.1 alpha-amylase [Xanthomonas phaseoli pv. phaseoli]KGT53068.2 alpha-amylase [Xanthomonas phaseoli pv. phaseoli]
MRNTPAHAPPSLLQRGARLLLTALVLLLTTANAQADVILHAFNWPYATVEARAKQIADAGYRKVLVAPAYRSEGSAWWARYQPQDIRLIDNPLGDTAAFKKMVQALANNGVETYADIVFNHMANEAATRSDLNYPGSAVLSQYAANPGRYDALRLFGTLQSNFLSASDFGPAQCISNYNDAYQVRNYRICGGGSDPGLPDLIGNDWVVQQQRAYLQALKSIGVTGFRVDAAKHMTFDHLNRVFDAGIGSGVYVFGEVITGGGTGNGDYDQFLAPYLQSTPHAAYDFPLFNAVRNAFAIGASMQQLVDPAASGQALPGNRAVTFAVTHDIPNNAGFRYAILDPVDETLAYAYLIGRNGGMPMIYTDNNESGDNRWVNAYLRDDLRRMIGFHNGVQGTDMQVLSSSSCHILFRRGSLGIVGINKCGNPVTTTVGMNNSVLYWNADYVDALGSGNVVRISSSSYTFTLPARGARMWRR